MQNPGHPYTASPANNYFAIFTACDGNYLGCPNQCTFMEYDLSMLKKLAGDDERFIIEILTTFKRTSPPIVRQMVDFEAQKKYEAVGREAHKLIPGVSFLGAARLKEVLINIEDGAKNDMQLDEMHEHVANAARMVDELIRVFEKDFNLDPDPETA